MEKDNELKLKITYIKTVEGGYVGAVNGIYGAISEADTLDELKENLFNAAKAIISVNEDHEHNNGYPFFELDDEVFEDELVLRYEPISTVDSQIILNGILYEIDKTFKLDKIRLDEDGIHDEYVNLEYIIIPKDSINDTIRLGKFNHVELTDLSDKIKLDETYVILEDGDDCYGDELFPILLKSKIK